MNRWQLHFQILSYWHCGSGRGGGQEVNALVHKDSHGLPELPGRSIKGLVRDAVQRAEWWGHLPQGVTTLWFGTDTRDYQSHGDGRRDHTEVYRYETQPGLLTFDNAVLPHEVSCWLRGEDARVRQGLFRQLHSTAMNLKTGTAVSGSLRGMEVVVPLDLFAPVALQACNHQDADARDWPQMLQKCLPLIQGLGLARGRGLGRCRVTLEEVS